jgi:predicted nucleic-acid-binding protein
MKIANTNVYLRYLLRDNTKHYETARDLLESTEVYLPVEVLCEIIYVLERVYKINRVEICDNLALLLQDMNIVLPIREVVMESLILYKDTKLAYVDCLLASYSKVNGDEIYTFDEKLAKTVASFK